MTLSDYLHLSPFEGILQAINAQYSFDYHPQRTQLDHLEIDDTDPTRINLRLKTHISSSDQNRLEEPSRKAFTLQRLWLADYLNASGPFLVKSLTPPFSADDFLHHISESTGIHLTHDDIEPMYWTDYRSDNTYVVRAHPLSLRWAGSFVVSFDHNKADIADSIVQTELPALWLSDSPKNIAAYQLMDVDFTGDRDDLIWLERDDDRLPVDRLVDILRRNHQASWQMTNTPSVFNLTWEVVSNDTGVVYPLYKVLYNGRVKSEWTPVKDKRYVLVLALSPEYCLNLSGMVLLHYN